LAAGDEAHAAALVEAHAPPALRRGALLTVRAWLARLPDPLVRARPRLGLAAAMLQLLAGDLEAAGARLRGAEQALAASPEPLADLHAELAALRAYQAMELGDMTRGPALIEQALATLPALSPWRVTMLFSAGQLAFDAGDLPAAEQALAETVRLGEEQGNRMAALMA
jgi:ATP/maltotriose-dependent transcriptional regulator MalT